MRERHENERRLTSKTTGICLVDLNSDIFCNAIGTHNYGHFHFFKNVPSLKWLKSDRFINFSVKSDEESVNQHVIGAVVTVHTNRGKVCKLFLRVFKVSTTSDKCGCN